MPQQWKIYKSMSVSNDSMTTQQMFCNVSGTNDSELSIMPINNYHTNNDSSILETSSITQNTSYESHQDECPSTSRLQQIVNDTTVNECPRVQKRVLQKLNIINEKKFKNHEEDENYQFLMSLLPYLRDVPKHRKLTVRHKLQKVFIDEEERNVATNPKTSHIPIPSRPPPPYPQTEFNFVVPQAPAATGINPRQSNIIYSNSNLMHYNNNNATSSTANTEQSTWTY